MTLPSVVGMLCGLRIRAVALGANHSVVSNVSTPLAMDCSSRIRCVSVVLVVGVRGFVSGWAGFGELARVVPGGRCVCVCVCLCL